jgi:type IV secretory pathway VirB4 component
MGVTGSGKSTFISKLADQAVTIGHGLESCMPAPNFTRVQLIQCRHDRSERLQSAV